MTSDDGFDAVAWGALVLLVLAFGSSFFWFALVLTQYDGWVTGAMRFVVAGIFLPGLCLATGIGLPSRWVEWRWCAAYGIVGFVVPFYIVAHAQTVVPSSTVAVYFAAIPLFVLTLSRLVLGVTITARKWAGCAIGSVGLVYMAGPGTLSQLGDGATLLPSFGIAIAALFLAGGAIVIRKMPRMNPIRTAAGATIVAAVVSLPVLALTFPDEAPSGRALAGILGGGIITTGIGQMLRVFLVRRKGPVFLTPVGYLTAVVAVLLGVVVLGERFATETAIAFAIILGGLMIAQDGSGNMKAA